MKKVALFLSAIFIAAGSATLNAQITTPQPSPLQTIKQNIGLSDVEITYSRPSSKGRAVFGDLVPYGTMWRTGANASTKIKFSDEFTVNGTKVPKGEYALYTIPEQGSWTIAIYNDVSCWGVCENYDQSKEVARFKVNVNEVPQTETFTIGFHDLTYNSAVVRLSWEKKSVDFTVTHDVDTKVTAQIEQFINPKPDFRPYYNAASYYLETGKDLQRALEWANKAYELNPRFWVSHLKAKIQYAMKDYKGAIITAEQSKNSAIADKNQDYVLLNEKLISKAKTGK